MNVNKNYRIFIEDLWTDTVRIFCLSFKLGANIFKEKNQIYFSYLNFLIINTSFLILIFCEVKVSPTSYKRIPLRFLIYTSKMSETILESNLK